VVEGQRVPEGALEAGGGHAVEVDDGGRGTERIAIFAPGEGTAIRENEGLSFCCHYCGTGDLDGILLVSTVGRSYFRKFSSHAHDNIRLLRTRLHSVVALSEEAAQRTNEAENLKPASPPDGFFLFSRSYSIPTTWKQNKPQTCHGFVVVIVVVAVSK
jgi:hypothetical protein